MNILTIAAAAVGLYFLAGSKKPQEAKKDEGGVIKGDKVDPNKPEGGILGGTGGFKQPKPPIIPKGVMDINTLGCSANQYSKDGKCITFWDDKTDAQVIKKITEKAQKWYDSTPLVPKENKVGEGYITSLCSDENDGMGNFETNKQAMQIIKETIVELWPVVTKDALPPTAKSANWLKEIWNRVVTIYYHEICGL